MATYGTGTEVKGLAYRREERDGEIREYQMDSEPFAWRTWKKNWKR